MMHYLLILLLEINMLWAGVDPFIVFNTQNINTPQTITPLPKEQLITAFPSKSHQYQLSNNEQAEIFIKANETLFIVSKEETNTSILANISQDGRLFQEKSLFKDRQKNYTLHNEYNKMIVVKLSSDLAINVSFYTTFNSSSLNLMKGIEISLPGENVEITSPSALSSQHYYRFKNKKKFSFQVQGPGTLNLSMRAPLHPIKNLAPYRQRILLAVNKEKPKCLESLNSTSLSYLTDLDHTAVTDKSSHFVPLKAGNNTITLKTYSDILISANLYKENIINPINDSNLTWEVPNKLDFINQPQWHNTNINDGIKRMRSILAQKKNMVDSLQRTGLEDSAYLSTFMKQLYPLSIPIHKSFNTLNYGIRSLYLKEDYKYISSLAPYHEIANLNTIKNGVFFEVPLDKTENLQEELNVTLERLYFKTREYKLDKGLKRQVETLLSHIDTYKHIYLYGHTDSTGGSMMNIALSQKRCQSIKKAMINLGIPEKDISITFEGEKDQRIQTQDEAIEASNRRVEIKVLHQVPINKKLEYQFKKPIESNTPLEITLSSVDDFKKELYLYIDNQKPETLRYEIAKNLQPFSFSTGLDAYAKHTNNNPDKTISILKNTKEQALISHTGTIVIMLPKGTRHIRLARAKDSTPYDVSLRIREGSIYKDTPYALAYAYAGSYLRFADSLHQSLPSKKEFDPWYEHTHPLRLWINSNIAQAYNNVESSHVPDASTIEYAQTLFQNNDRFTTLQIAKHALLFSFDKDIQKKAYDLLLKLSKDNTERLTWHCAYFYKTKSSLALYKIALLLQKEGKSEYALNAFLLLDRDPSTIKHIGKLALVQNDLVLYEYLSKSNTLLLQKAAAKDYLEKKYAILSSVEYQKNLSTNNINILESAGTSILYSEKRDEYFHMYKSTASQPLKLEIEGPITLELDIRFESQATCYQWMRIEYNAETYHYPLTQFQPSTSLRREPGEHKVSVANSISLSFGKGKHILSLHGYEDPLLIGVNSKSPDMQTILPLEKQILKTSSYNPSYWVHQTPKGTVPYVSALLWNYKYETLDYRYHAQAQALMLIEKTSNPEIQNILNPLVQYSNFITYTSPEAPLGFYDITVPNWHPQSTTEKNRLLLLKGMESYDMVLHGADYKIIHLEGNQRFTLNAKQFTPKYFIFEPLTFGISLNGEAEKIIHLDPLKTEWTRHFDLAEGNHSIKIRLLNPLSTQYLAFNLREGAKRVKRDSTKRYFAATKEEPITIHEKGPILLRIEEILSDNTSNIYYTYLPESKIYHYKIVPSSNDTESLIHISQFIFYPLKKSFSTLTVASDIPVLLDNIQKENKLFSISNEIPHGVPLESHDPTFSFEMKILGVQLGSDDNQNSVSTQVMQVGGYLRTKFEEDSFLRMHYFTNLHQNPLYALQHKIYTKMPFFDDTWSTFEANGYFQENNNYWFKNLHLRAEFFKEKDFSSQWRHRYGIGIFKYFLDYDNPNNELLDPLVFSRYKRDHQYGIYSIYDLAYRPYDDLEFAFKTNLYSNEQFNIIDNLKVQFNLYHHIHPFDIKIYFDKWYYFEDRNRPDDYTLDRIGGNIGFEDFFDTNRLDIEAGLNYNLYNKDTQFLLGLTWHFSHNKRFYNFMPDEKLFNALRLRLEDERE